MKTLICTKFLVRAFITALSCFPLCASVAQIAGDGVTDDTKALNVFLRSHKNIDTVLNGSYRISNQLVKNGGSLRLRGGRFIVDKDFQRGGPRGVFNIHNVNNLLMQGIIIEGNREKFSFIDSVSEGVPTGILVRNSHNIRIEHCTISNTPSNGISIYRDTNFAVSNNVITRPYAQGVFAEFSEYGSIDSNYITGLKDEVTTELKRGGIGILVTLSKHITMTKDTIIDMTDTGTKSEGSDSIGWYNCYVLRPGKDGIKFMDYYARMPHSTGCEMIGNEVDAPVVRRIDGSACFLITSASDVVVKNNIARSSLQLPRGAGIGIFFQLGITKTTNAVVMNNKVYNSPRAIAVGKAENVLVADNLFYDCKQGVVTYESSSAVEERGNQMLKQ